MVRLATFTMLDHETQQAVMWLRENKHQFTGIVSEPIMTEINIKCITDAKYFSNIISLDDMKAFVCENIQDFFIFVKQRFPVNVVYLPRECAQDVYHPDKPLDDLKRYGFRNYMTDLYDLPKTVHQYLCYNYSLHNTPIGGEQVNMNSGQIAVLPGVSKFCSGDCMYTVRLSAYTGLPVITVTALH